MAQISATHQFLVHHTALVRERRANLLQAEVRHHSAFAVHFQDLRRALELHELSRLL